MLLGRGMGRVPRPQAAVPILSKTQEVIYYSGHVSMLDQDLGKSSLYPQQSKQPLWTWDTYSAPQLLSCICILLSCD